MRATATSEPVGSRGGVGSASPRGARGERLLDRVDELVLQRLDVLVPVDAVLAVGGPDDALLVAVDHVDAPAHPAEGAQRRRLARQLVVLQLRPRAGDDERRDALDREPLFLAERALGRAPLETRQTEEHAALVQEEKERMGEAVRDASSRAKYVSRARSLSGQSSVAT